MRNRLLRVIPESSNTAVLTNTQFSIKTINGVTYFLQTTFRSLHRRLLSRETVVLDELANLSNKTPKRSLKPFGSTASSLQILANPAVRMTRYGRSAVVENDQENQEQREAQESELGLTEKPRPRLRKKAQPVELLEQPMYPDQLIPVGLRSAPRRPRLSLTLSARPSVRVFVAITVFALGTESLQHDELLLSPALMMAFQQVAQSYMLAYQAEVSDLRELTAGPSPLFSGLSSATFSAAFGNPLQLVRLRAPQQPPNPQQFFAQNYYQPAAARPVPPTPSNEQRLEAVGFPSADLAPDAFKCALRSLVMDNPVKLPLTNQTCDGRSVLEALKHKAENPYNRQPMKMEDATPDLNLRRQITGYVDAVVKGVEDKRKALGQNTLSQDDYQAIHDSAMKSVDQQAAPAAPAPQRR